VNPTCGCDVVDVERLGNLNLAVDASVEGSSVSESVCLFGVGAGSLHSYFLKNVASEELLPSPAADGFDQFTCHWVKNVVIGIATSETAGERHVTEFLDYLLPGKRRRRPKEEISGAEAQAASMDEKITDRDFSRHVWVAELKRGKVIDDWLISSELASVD
jgi:hypothetical protein